MTMVMDGSITFFSSATWFAFLLLLSHASIISASGIFKVQHKFAGLERSLKALMEHDSNRHGGRMLSTMDLPLGGITNPYEDGLYYTKVSIGTPAKDYNVKVDTRSPILWVTCAGCDNCPKSNSFGMMNASLYDLKASSTGKQVGCDQEFCSIAYHGADHDCKTDTLCQYTVGYGDGNPVEGYFVEDYLKYKQDSDNSLSLSDNSSIVFGCSTKQADNLGSSKGALDGVIGFGPSNTSMISQLASAGKVKKIFSHCLDAEKGGGIFAIGEVVEPKVKTTPLVPDMTYYKVNLKEIKVGETPLNISLDAFKNGDEKGTVIDTGTALAYLPKEVYDPLKRAILAEHNDLKLVLAYEIYTCFKTNENIDDMLPTITFTFEGSLSLTVFPRQYIFKAGSHLPWCLNFQAAPDDTKMIILGDALLANKLVVYDLENQAIGWVEHNCTSSVKLQDGKSGPTHQVGYHDLASSSSSSSGRDFGSIFTLLLLSFIFQKLY